MFILFLLLLTPTCLGQDWTPNPSCSGFTTQDTCLQDCEAGCLWCTSTVVSLCYSYLEDEPEPCTQQGAKVVECSTGVFGWVILVLLLIVLVFIITTILIMTFLGAAWCATKLSSCIFYVCCMCARIKPQQTFDEKTPLHQEL